MKWMLACVATIALGGCATYSDLQQKPPFSVEHTERPPSAFADCALPLVVDVQADAHTIKDGNAVAIIIPIGNRGGDLAATVTASPSAAGSDVSVRAISDRSAAKVLHTVKPCL